MRFPNAYKGLSKILISQILQIIAGVLAVITAAFGISSIVLDAAGETSAQTGFVLTSGLGIALVVVTVVAYVLYIKGIVEAKKDEETFSVALVMVIVGLACSVASSLLMLTNPVLANWLDFVSSIAGLTAFEYVVVGVVNLAQQMGNPGLVKFGKTLRVIITIIWIILLVVQIAGNTVPALAFLGGVAGILELIAVIMYIVFLVKAKKMLK